MKKIPNLPTIIAFITGLVVGFSGCALGLYFWNPVKLRKPNSKDRDFKKIIGYSLIVGAILALVAGGVTFGIEKAMEKKEAGPMKFAFCGCKY